ncbi:hypoxanthine phosphoribosyltransferase [Metamycoplasma hyosynoviae]|uniref:hypoxanthine phosphoribosyltransferase n=1 Tax=Metamycoplasma hyosynoviae TaxID=29559 RepID=UPI002359013C|nr:hypoxanthine phosphoribosyltransferase [Metamycoplasma hyosynoviae]MDC8919232.1 hypoxanthine phosphoribosyltransferase [Metamycoplasma hyosynoviae]MDD7837743.1 hypoxanthine phosphoribosyltransferase [Metamycoplasma hyosynoviae]
MKNECHPLVEKILFSHKQLQEKIAELAIKINKDYEKSNSLVIVGILKGCIPFLAEFIKNLDVDHILDFMVLSSYQGKTTQTGSVKIVLDLVTDIYKKDVLIVEDIVDTGQTLTKVKNLLLTRSPNSLKVVTLLDKPSNRKVEFKPDYVGFEIKNEFVVGFGFDYDEKLRNLPYIGILKKEN